MNALKNIETDIETIGVSIDSREIEKDNLFIALVGENFDAHSKIQETLENGATLAIVNKDWYENNLAIAKDMPLIVVSDTLKAFHKLARFHRFRYDCNILAVAVFLLFEQIVSGVKDQPDFIHGSLAVKEPLHPLLKSHPGI